MIEKCWKPLLQRTSGWKKIFFHSVSGHDDEGPRVYVKRRSGMSKSRSRYMKVKEDRVIVSMRRLSRQLTREFRFQDFRNREEAVEEAERWIYVRSRLPRRATITGHPGIRESVSRVNGLHYLIPRYFRDGRLIRTASAGRLSENTDHGRRMIRDSTSDVLVLRRAASPLFSWGRSPANPDVVPQVHLFA